MIKKTYAKPALVKRDSLAKIAAGTATPVSGDDGNGAVTLG